MLKTIHPVAGALALATITSFWLSTLISEMAGARAAVIAAKTAVPWGLLLLVPALAAAGLSGRALAKGGRAGAKGRRMPIIAANGLCLLAPAAFFLAHKAHAGQFDTAFYAVQALELAAGAINIALLGLNLRDGLIMTGRIGRR